MSVIRLPTKLHKLLKSEFKGNWDTHGWLGGGLKGENYNRLNASEKVGYHLHEAAGALQILIWNRAENKIIDGLSPAEKELYLEYVDRFRTRPGENSAPPDEIAPVTESERAETASRIADQVLSEMHRMADELGEKEVVLEVLGDRLTDVLFYEAIKRRVQKMTISEFNGFAKDFLTLYTDPRFSLTAPGGAWPGQSQFLDLLERWGFDTSGTGLIIGPLEFSEHDPWIHTVDVLLTKIGNRGQDLYPHLKRSYDTAKKYRGIYVEALKDTRKKLNQDFPQGDMTAA
jgi:hypothetical protein